MGEQSMNTYFKIADNDDWVFIHVPDGITVPEGWQELGRQSWFKRLTEWMKRSKAILDD